MASGTGGMTPEPGSAGAGAAQLGEAEPARAPSGPAQADRRGVLPFPLKNLGPARQVVLVTSRSWTGTQARLEGYENGENGWELRIGPVAARVGRTGMIPEGRRVAGSGTTPAGTFPLSLAFGIEPDPGTAMPYVCVASDDYWWVGDPASPHYNNLRTGSEGGFTARESGNRASERLAARPQEYAYALVIDFNRPYSVRTRGSGIFIRVTNGLSTDGSVAVERAHLLELLAWLDPDARPVITMAPERVISQY